MLRLRYITSLGKLLDAAKTQKGGFRQEGTRNEVGNKADLLGMRIARW